MASAAIHGLLLISWSTDMPGNDAASAVDGLPSILVELLQEEGPKEAAMPVADIAPARRQSIPQLTKPAPEKPVRSVSRNERQKPVERQTTGEQRVAQEKQKRPESGPGMKIASAWSASHIRHLIRQRLESFKYYPASARRRGIEGSVEVRFALASGGRATGLEVVAGSGYAILDHAAVDTVARAQPFPVSEGVYRFRLRFSRL